jgi:hypothetical protein
MRSGRGRPFSGWSPRYWKPKPTRSASDSESIVAAETSTCPPFAAEQMGAA